MTIRGLPSVTYRDYTKKVLTGTELLNMDFPSAGNNQPDARNPSLYQIDYILIHFDEMIRRAIETDADVINNVNFQKFMFWVSEYERILLESRDESNTTGEALPPFGKGAAKPYACKSGHKYTQAMALDLYNAIHLGVLSAGTIVKLNPKIYHDFTSNVETYGLPAKYYTRGCSVPAIDNFIKDVIIPTIDSYAAYQAYTSTPNIGEENFIDEYNDKFQKIMAITNDKIKEGDYASIYDMIEIRLKDTVGLLDNLASAANTEENIIEQSTDIATYYEKLNFLDINVDAALQNPLDSIDMVDMDSSLQTILQSNLPYSNPSTAQIIGQAQGITQNMTNVVNLNAMHVHLLRAAAKLNNLVNPPLEFRTLMQTTMYKDDNGNIIVQYLDDAAEKDIRKKEKTRQKNYLSLISGPNPPEARLVRYTAEYPEQKFTGGYNSNDSKTKKYKFKKSSKLTKTVSKSGGREINIQNLIKGGGEVEIPDDSLAESTKIVTKTTNEIARIEDLYKK